MKARAPAVLVLEVGELPSPMGSLLAACDRDGALRALEFADCAARLQRSLRRHYGERGFALEEKPAPRLVAVAFAAHFAGDLCALDALKLRAGGSAFQQRVWLGLRSIAPGTTTTYGALARALGQPSAARAVGLANGANPIGIAVPCHRVIGANGALTGYGGGVERKRWLLEHERAHATPRR